MVKKLLSSAAASLIIFFNSFGFCAEAESDNYYFFDDTYSISESECSIITRELKTAADETGMNVGLYLSASNRSQSGTEDFTKSLNENVFGEDSDSVMYYIDLSGASSVNDFIASSGTAQLYITDSGNTDYDDEPIYGNRIDNIFYSNDENLVKGNENIVEAAKLYCSKLISYKNKGMVEGSFYYSNKTGKYYAAKNGEVVEKSMMQINISRIGSSLFIGLFVGLIIWVIIFLVVKQRYKFRSTPSAAVYTGQNDIIFHKRSDVFIRKYTTRVNVSDNNHHSHGTSRSRSHGGSHGGGGHRR